MLPIRAPGNAEEPPEEPYCEDCDNYGDDCECREYYIEEKDEY
jgi:hypothetical protein